MKAFRNPLESILEIRRLQEGQRETELFAALAERDREQAKLEGIRSRQRDAARYLPSAGAPAVGQSLLVRERFVEHQRRLAAMQQQTLARAREEVESRQASLVEARREVRTFEIHRSRLHGRWQAEVRREEQNLSDDIVSARHGLRSQTASEAESPAGFAARRRTDGVTHG